MDDSFENLILLCPNHHNQVDNLERDRFDAETLLDWKWAIERGDVVGFEIPDTELERVAREIAVKSKIHLAVAGQREPIRSDPSRTATAAAEPTGRSGRRATPKRWSPPPSAVSSVKVRVHALANELGMTSRELLDLADRVGVPAASPSSTIPAAYGDLLRRRAKRDGLTRLEAPIGPK